MTIDRRKPNLLKHIRRGQGIMMTDLCIRAGMSTATIVGIERYGLFPGDDVRQRLAEVLQVEESDIWPHLSTIEQTN